MVRFLTQTRTNFNSLALSLIHHDLVYAVSGIIYFVSIIVVTINYLQDNKPEVLPYVLRNWQFLPKPLRTFSTVDYVVQTYMEVCSMNLYINTYHLLHNFQVYCCCFVRRTVSAVPVLSSGFNFNKKDEKLFGINIHAGGNKDIQLVKLDRKK